MWLLLNQRRSSSPPQGDKGQHWLQVHAPLSKPTTKVMSHTCVSAVGSALTWLGRGYPIQRASSHRARPRRLRAGQRSCPATGRFDRRVFFALGWLVWVRWSAQWPRSSKIPKSWSGLRAGAGLSGPVCGLSGARSTRASTSTRGLLRPRAAASMSRLRVLLVSSPWAAVRLHG